MMLQRLLSRSFYSCFGLNPVELSGRKRQGGVLALIKSEFPALGREAAGLLSHHPETLPSQRGSLASLIQPHCHMNNHTAVALMGLRYVYV